MLILTTFNLDLRIILETNTSDFAIGAYLRQLDKQGKSKLVAYYLRKLTLAELNYNVYNKELLVIVIAFK